MVRFLMVLILIAAYTLGVAARAERGTIVIERDTSPTIGANNQFGLELYDKIRSRPGNVSLSPASVSSALAMTAEGASGTTAVEMARVLHLPDDREAGRDAYQALMTRLNGDGSPRPYRLDVANSLWGQRGHAFLPGFLKVASTTYAAGLASVDFAGDLPAAVAEINAWVDRKTNHRIPKLLQVADLSPPPSLVLVNTVYLKADWASPFEPLATQDAPFHASPSKTITVPMMRQSGTFPLAETETAQILQMPYKGDDLAMMVLLPKSADGLDALEASLRPAQLDAWIGKLAMQKVIVELPKFQVTTRADLSKPLAALGMPSAFEPSADFRGIDGTRDLFLSKVIHQVVVDVDEKGTEAAAATSMMMTPSRASISRPVVFRADRPFVYLIRDLKTGSILFLGRVAEPK